MLKIANHRDDGHVLSTEASRQAYTQYLLAAIFKHGYRVCVDPVLGANVSATVTTMADGTYSCLDMPLEHEGTYSAPDGGVDLFDFIHFLMVRSGSIQATDILRVDVALDKPSCSGGTRRSRSRALVGEHPMADWVVSDELCESNERTCHYTCNADPSCHFAMRPTLHSTTASGSFFEVDAPAGGFRAMQLLFTRSALQSQCTTAAPTAYCYSTAYLQLIGTCTNAFPPRRPTRPHPLPPKPHTHTPPPSR